MQKDLQHADLVLSDQRLRKWATDRAIGIHLATYGSDRRAAAILETAQKIFDYLKAGTVPKS